MALRAKLYLPSFKFLFFAEKEVPIGNWSAYSRSGAGRPVKNGFPNENPIGIAPCRDFRSGIFIPHKAPVGTPKKRSNRDPDRVHTLIINFFLSRRSPDRESRSGPQKTSPNETPIGTAPDRALSSQKSWSGILDRTPKIPFQTRPRSGAPVN